MSDVNAIESSDSEDHFSDAKSAPTSPSPNSPVPRTRVEKVTTDPAYGETPGTEAYRKREGDAEPDEIAVISEEIPKPFPAPSTPPQVPLTIVTESTGATGPHSPLFKERLAKEQKADATPDIVLRPDEEAEGAQGNTVVSKDSPANADGNESGTVMEKPI